MTWTFIYAIAQSPLVGRARSGDGDRKVLHGVTAGALAAYTALQAPLVAACGQAAVLVSIEDELLPWPVYARVPPYRRCRPCWVATGKRPPRTALTITSSLADLMAEKWGVCA